MQESKIESYLRDEVKKQGGKAYKFVSPGNSGVPDRIVLMPGRKVYFVELKASGKKPTDLQLKVHKDFSNLDFEVHVIDSKELVDEFIQMVKG